MKNQVLPVILHKNLKSAELNNRKYGKPILHSLIANHVLEMSVKLKFQCARYKKKHCFALVALNLFSICFYQGLFTQCNLYHKILLSYYAETKEIIYGSVNLEGILCKPKQNSFSQSSHV